MAKFKFECRYINSNSGIDFEQEVDAPDYEVAKTIMLDHKTAEHFDIIHAYQWNDDNSRWINIH